jgi:hypothetical protein
MPASAYALVATFAVISLLAGAAAARLVGPRRWWSVPLPAAAAFGALYLVGHRWVVGIGPEVTLWGWEVALPFDIVVAIGMALLVASLQRGVLGLLESQERGPGRDGLA